MEAFAPSLPEAVFAAAGERRRSLWNDAVREIRQLIRYRHLARHLFTTALRFEHVGTVFGYFWWILEPLLLGTTYVILIDVILHVGGPHYPVFVFTAVVVFKFLTASIRSAMAQTFGRQGLMKQIAFPRSIIPIVAVAAEAARFWFALLALLGFAAVFGLYPNSSLVFLPLIVLIQIPLLLGVALMLSGLGVLFRDIDRATESLLRMWFYLSPGVYSLSRVPSGTVRRLYDINPFASLFPAYHAVFIDHTTPNLAALGLTAVESLVVLIGGFLVFVRLAAAFAKVR